MTAVCGTKNLELMRSLGAARVIDYRREDFTHNGERYDVHLRRRQALVRPLPRFAQPRRRLSGHRRLQQPPLGALDRPLRRPEGQVHPAAALPRADVALLKELVETRRFRAVIDRTYAMEDVVDAAGYVETRQKTGNVVLRIAG